MTIKASQNNLTQSTSDLSDIYDAASTNTNGLTKATTGGQNHRPSDTYDISDAITDLQFNSNHEPPCSRSDENHAQIPSNTNGKDDGDVHLLVLNLQN